MPYSQFTTLRKALDDFNLKLAERSFFYDSQPFVEPGETVAQYVEIALPLAARGSEKARSEGIVFPLLLELRQIFNGSIALFSGEEFTVEPEIGLSGVCDFLICRSPLISIIEAPVVALVEAKKADISSGLGQCVAEMVAALRFNQANGLPITTVYGVVTTGVLWRYLRLDDNVVTMDLTDYPLMPLAETLGRLRSLLVEH